MIEIITVPVNIRKVGNEHNYLKTKAKENNELYYFTGKPCRRGHVAKRFTHNSVCVECDNFHKINNGENSRLKHVYGITLEQYNEMFQAQNGVCKICRQPETKFVNKKICKLAVDHCHETKIVRGLLCYACNVGIGFFKHNAKFLRNAALYCEEV